MRKIFVPAKMFYLTRRKVFEVQGGVTPLLFLGSPKMVLPKKILKFQIYLTENLKFQIYLTEKIFPRGPAIVRSFLGSRAAMGTLK